MRLRITFITERGVRLLLGKSGRVYPEVDNTFVRRLFRRKFSSKSAPVKRMSL